MSDKSYRIRLPENLPPCRGEEGYEEYLEQRMNQPPCGMPRGPYRRTSAKVWYPVASEVVRTPRTAIVPVEYDLIFLVDGMEPKGYEELLERLDKAASEIGYPVFFRSGQTSAKHDWDHAHCVVRCREDFKKAIPALVEYSCMGFPEQSWEILMVRQFLDVKAICRKDSGTPISREFRFFIEDGAVSHVQPYWPEHAVAGHTEETGWEERLREMSVLSTDEYEYLKAETLKVAQAVPGDWSVDWLQDRNGDWWMIDMADAAVSYCWVPEFSVVADTECGLKP